MLELHYLPPYSPQLNPDAQVWKNIKERVAKQIPRDKYEMRVMLRNALERLQSQPEIVRGFFAHPECGFVNYICLFVSINQDPIGLMDEINNFTYVGGDPINGIDPFGLSRLTIVYSNGSRVVIDNPSGTDLINAVNVAPDRSITLFQLMGHGDQYAQCISQGNNCSDTLVPDLSIQSSNHQIGSIKNILPIKMSSMRQVNLEDCNNASGESNITKSISENLPNIPVTGGYGYQLGYENHWLFGNSSGSLGFKQTYINGNPKK
jgi:hypothetical protein